MLDNFNCRNDSSVCFTDCGTNVRVSLFNLSKKSVKWHTMIKLRYGRKMKEYFTDFKTGEIFKNPESERRSVRRARVAIVDLALCNSFDYFGTLTIDDKKHNVLDVAAVTNKLRASLHSYSLISAQFKYIVVPEYGSKNNRLHFHFLFKGVRSADLFYNEYGKLDFSYFKDRFGFVQITKIKKSRADIERTAKYCAKYMSKDNVQINGHRYFRSKGLKMPNKTVFSKPLMARWINKFLKKYEDCVCYYAEKCKSYDLPLPLFKKLYEMLLEKNVRFDWLCSSGVADPKQLSLLL